MEQSLIFGDVISSDYGIYISGEGVFNAPRRDAEMISIPGRNGTYLLDHNRFDNIVVTYPAHCVADNMDEFRSKLRDYRNALSAKRGYQRLSDTINGDEYRMASFIDGFDSEPIGFSLASTFELKFNCKPQRFLKSGEIEQSVTSGDTITNPTLFESHPLLLVDGYGDININNDVISIQRGAIIGATEFNHTERRTIEIANRSITSNINMTSDVSNVGLHYDPIRIGDMSINVEGLASDEIEAFEFTSGTHDQYFQRITPTFSHRTLTIAYTFKPSVNFVVGESRTETKTATADYSATIGGQTVTGTINFQAVCTYDGQNTFTFAITTTFDTNFTAYRGLCPELTTQCIVNSTKSALGNLYIDLDIGECYRIENGEYISINTATTLPAELPTLKPGDNIITYGEDFTSFKITPRYWRV